MINIIIAEEENCGGESVATRYFKKKLKKSFRIFSFSLEGVSKTDFIDFFLWHFKTIIFSLKTTYFFYKKNPGKTIFYTTSYLPGVGALILIKLKIINAKICFHYHGNRVPDYPKKNFGLIKKTTQILKYKFVKALHQCLLKNSSLVVFTSESSKKLFCNDFKNFHLKKSTIIPNGVNRNKFAQIRGSKKRKLKKELKISSKHVVSLVGSLNERKNQLIFLESLKYLNNQDITYLLAFPRPKNKFEFEYLEKIDKYLSDNRIGRTRILFFQGYPQIEHIYQVSDCTIIISSREDFPLCLLESLACGVPVITSTKGITKALIKQKMSKELVIKDLSPATLAKTIDIFFRMQLFDLNNLTDRSINTAKEFTWKKSAELLEKELNLI